MQVFRLKNKINYYTEINLILNSNAVQKVIRTQGEPGPMADLVKQQKDLSTG